MLHIPVSKQTVSDELHRVIEAVIDANSHVEKIKEMAQGLGLPAELVEMAPDGIPEMNQELLKVLSQQPLGITQFGDDDELAKISILAAAVVLSAPNEPNYNDRQEMNIKRLRNIAQCTEDVARQALARAENVLTFSPHFRVGRIDTGGAIITAK